MMSRTAGFAETLRAAHAAREPQVVYLQATTGKLHRRKDCGVTSRTRYSHFEVEFTAERREKSERCARCWDGHKPEAPR